MNIRFLETFLWISRLGSFRAAANKLNLTQAAVSGRIAAMENELNKPLFERGSREVRLTTYGQTLLQYAQEIVETEQTMRTAINGAVPIRGRVRLGVVESIIHTWFAPFIKHLHETYPDLEIELTAESTLRLHDVLKRGIIDVALQTDPIIARNIRNRPMGFLQMGFIRAGSNPSIKPISFKQMVSKWPVVTFPRHSQPHLALLEVAEREATDIPRIHFVSSIAASIQLIDSGLGVGTLPLAAMQEGINKGEYHVVPCTAGLPDLRLVASWRSDPLAGLSEAIIIAALNEMKKFAENNPDAVALHENTDPIFI